MSPIKLSAHPEAVPVMAAIDKNPNASSDLKKALEDLSVEKYSARFNILQARYSSKDGDPIRVDVLVPRKLPANKFSAPIMVRIHGGFLVSLPCSCDF